MTEVPGRQMVVKVEFTENYCHFRPLNLSNYPDCLMTDKWKMQANLNSYLDTEWKRDNDL